jgi:hypothetical protein
VAFRKAGARGGPGQLIKTATGQRLRRLRDEAAAARQRRHLCCDRTGCGPSAGGSGSAEQRSGQHFGHHRCRRWVVQLRPVAITRYGSGLSSPKMTSVASTTDNPGLSLPIPARGPARRLRRQYPRDGVAACIVQRLGADERGPRRVAVRAGMIMLTLAVMVIARCLAVLSPAGLPQRGRSPSDRARPEPVG